jgi:hypothetical protein
MNNLHNQLLFKYFELIESQQYYLGSLNDTFNNINIQLNNTMREFLNFQHSTQSSNLYNNFNTNRQIRHNNNIFSSIFPTNNTFRNPFPTNNTFRNPFPTNNTFRNPFPTNNTFRNPFPNHSQNQRNIFQSNNNQSYWNTTPRRRNRFQTNNTVSQRNSPIQRNNFQNTPTSQLPNLFQDSLRSSSSQTNTSNVSNNSSQNRRQNVQFQNRRNIIQNFINNTLHPNPINNPASTIDISNSTTTHIWRDYKNNTTETICPIDREQFRDNDEILVINNCKHVFKKHNLLKWFETNSECPMCRYNISTTQSQQTNENTLDTIINNTVDNITNTLINSLPRDLSNSITSIQYDIFSPQTLSSINLQPPTNNFIQRRNIILDNNLYFSSDISNNTPSSNPNDTTE